MWQSFLINRFIGRADSPWQARPQCWEWRGSAFKKCYGLLPESFHLGFLGVPPGLWTKKPTMKEEERGSRLRRVQNGERHSQVGGTEASKDSCAGFGERPAPLWASGSLPHPRLSSLLRTVPGVLPTPLPSAPRETSTLFTTRNEPVQNMFLKNSFRAQSPPPHSPTHLSSSCSPGGLSLSGPPAGA